MNENVIETVSVDGRINIKLESHRVIFSKATKALTKFQLNLSISLT